MPTRRQFLTTTGATAGLALTSTAFAVPKSDQTLRVGLLGAGGRGSKAAVQALRADPHAELVAVGEAFKDRLEVGLNSIKTNKDVADRLDVPPERRYVGFDAYKQVIDQVDVVLLATPPQFRPAHLRYAVDNKTHVFAEKPVAVDAPGVRSVLESTRLAKQRNLSIVSGLCLRYYNCFEETVKRLHDGEIGDVVALQANDYRGQIWNRTRESLAKVIGRAPTEMEYQMRNWYHFTWLCGDFNVEQHVHFLDVCAWVLKAYPTRCVCMGGRMTRPNTGNIYDQFGAVYEYASGAKVYSNCRQVRGRNVYRNIGCDVMGTKGSGVISESHSKNHLTIGDKRWQFAGKHNDFYQTEHDVLFNAVRQGNPVNNGQYMAHSTLMAIMARMSAYTGRAITWEQALNSKEDLSPSGYHWKAEPPSAEVAVPGVTPFV